jgi:hypothetical protein
MSPRSASITSPELGAEKYMNAAVPRVALRWPEEAAASLGVSADTLQRHGVAGDVKLWRLGSIRLVALDELERLVAGKSERTLRDGAA